MLEQDMGYVWVLIPVLIFLALLARGLLPKNIPNEAMYDYLAAYFGYNPESPIRLQDPYEVGRSILARLRGLDGRDAALLRGVIKIYKELRTWPPSFEQNQEIYNAILKVCGQIQEQGW